VTLAAESALHPDQLAWDLGYLIFGAALMLIGSAIAPRTRSAQRQGAAAPPGQSHASRGYGSYGPIARAL
jgi:hypothetical protein